MTDEPTFLRNRNLGYIKVPITDVRTILASKRNLPRALLVSDDTPETMPGIREELGPKAATPAQRIVQALGEQHIIFVFDFPKESQAEKKARPSTEIKGLSPETSVAIIALTHSQNRLHRVLSETPLDSLPVFSPARWSKEHNGLKLSPVDEISDAPRSENQ